MPISFSLTWAPDCKVRDHDAPAWRGQAARAIDVTCKDGVTTATYVPALLPVRDALLASGAIAKNDRLAKIEGLLVDARTEEGDPVITLADIAVASCDDLALPADRPRVTTLYAFRALPARIAEVKPAFDKKVSAVTEEMKGNIESQMREDLGRKCFGRPDGFSKEELVACVKSRPELHAKATMLATGLRVARAFVPTLEGIIRTDYDAPLCKLYAPESSAKCARFMRA